MEQIAVARSFRLEAVYHRIWRTRVEEKLFDGGSQMADASPDRLLRLLPFMGPPVYVAEVKLCGEAELWLVGNAVPWEN